MKALREIREGKLERINGGGIGDLELGGDKRLSTHPRTVPVVRDPLAQRFGIRDMVLGG